jgi:pyruvate kinase
LVTGPRQGNVVVIDDGNVVLRIVEVTAEGVKCQALNRWGSACDAVDLNGLKRQPARNVLKAQRFIIVKNLY